MSAFGSKADMTFGGNPLSRSLLGVKRTWLFAPHMSALDPKRTQMTPSGLPVFIDNITSHLALGGDMRRRDFIGLLGGAAAAWPIASRAQRLAVPLIGYLSGRSPEDTVRELEAFHKGLSEGGFVSGSNVNVEYRWARGDYTRLTALAAELVQRCVAVLAATGGDASASAAKEATSTIPVVFNMGGDPVKMGLAQSFNRPGGNVTGSTILTQDMEQKRFGILNKVVPDVVRFGGMVNSNYPASAYQIRELEKADRKSVV